MSIRTKSAGDILDANCTKCRVLTNHTIVALVEGRIARVKCNTCGSEHNYHAPKETKAPAVKKVAEPRVRTTATATAKKDTAPRYHEQWESALAGKDSSPVKEYDMEGKFKKEELVKHSTFGMGIVTMVAGTKMELLFSEGPKLLRCGK
jgi:Zn ribbon nucleic-acid-binding protein